MNLKILLSVALILSTSLLGAPPTTQPPAPAETITVDKNLTKQISDILKESQKIKPGTTRAELMRAFTTEGGLSTAKQRTYIYRGCPYIKINVEFTLSDPKQSVLDERPTDIVSEASQPYLEWSVMD